MVKACVPRTAAGSSSRRSSTAGQRGYSPHRRVKCTQPKLVYYAAHVSPVEQVGTLRHQHLYPAALQHAYSGAMHWPRVACGPWLVMALLVGSGSMLVSGHMWNGGMALPHAEQCIRLTGRAQQVSILPCVTAFCHTCSTLQACSGLHDWPSPTCCAVRHAPCNVPVALVRACGAAALTLLHQSTLTCRVAGFPPTPQAFVAATLHLPVMAGPVLHPHAFCRRWHLRCCLAGFDDVH